MKRAMNIFKQLHISIQLLLTIMFAIILLFMTIYFVSFILGPPSLTNEQNTLLYNANDEVIGYERGEENRHWVSLEDISESVIEATLAIEDKHFYGHRGFDLKRILGAAISDLRSLSLKEGASTLTQQYARNLYLSHEKTWWRKIKEAFYTIRLEMFYTKDEILEGYLNTIYYGHGTYGIETASQHFFDKGANDLTTAEAAMLSGIPKGPSYYSPLNNEKQAKGRQKKVLNLLQQNDFIDEKELYLARREHLNYNEHDENPSKQTGPYFQDTVLKEASHILDMDPEHIRSGGYSIYTTMEEDQQKHLESTIKDKMAHQSDIEIGAIAMDPHTGAIQALVGGRDYRESSFNRATMAKRMAGSTFKPFLYYTALHHDYTPSTQLLSEPTSFVLDNDEVYAPTNYNGYYANKPITLSQALAVSDNIYAVKTNLFLGPEKLPEMAKKFGINDDLPDVPSLALGTAHVTVDEMVTGFGRLANGGREISSYTIRKINDRNGKTIYKQPKKNNERILDPKKTFIMTHLLTGMFDTSFDGYTSVTGSSIADKLSHTYAGKSGSTTYDRWMIGYSPSLVTGIWTGYDDSQSIDNAEESQYAKDIWANFMEKAHQDKEEEEFSVPDGIVTVRVDPITGHLATPYCPTSRIMYYEAGTEPTTHCPTHFPQSDDPSEKDEKSEDEDDQGLFERFLNLFTFL